MAVFETSRPLAQTSQRAGFLASLVGVVIAWNDRRMTRIALSKLTSRELDDIGVTRADFR